ncbi:hypothetical protein ABTY98_02255 [Streptomyces sp. NPDC096040]|uniref:hypothetical protein n=1 Tax=Streptomyces sp. NPDC096040 TaxID=3155541 RepID=UPI003325A9FA
MNGGLDVALGNSRGPETPADLVGATEALDNDSTTSSELLQRCVGELAHAVKAFNT